VPAAAGPSLEHLRAAPGAPPAGLGYGCLESWPPLSLAVPPAPGLAAPLPDGPGGVAVLGPDEPPPLSLDDVALGWPDPPWLAQGWPQERCPAAEFAGGDPPDEPAPMPATHRPHGSSPGAPGPGAHAPGHRGPHADSPHASAAGQRGRGAGCREVWKAGRWDRSRGDGGGFAAGGAADRVLPGAALAACAADAWAGGLGRLSDDELVGVLRAARRLASWAAALELAAAGDVCRRRLAEEAAGDAGVAAHADDEVAAALTLTRYAAGGLLDLATALGRLPATSAALAAGDIDLPRAAVIAGELTGLGDAHAAAVDQVIAGRAAGLTTGQLRQAARRAVLAADPAAARRRAERAQRDARVERWDEHAGTAALAGRDLPPASVLAADHHLTALATRLKAAGVPGTMDTLRARAYLALLTGTPATSLLPGDPQTTSRPPHEPDDPGAPSSPA